MKTTVIEFYGGPRDGETLTSEDTSQRQWVHMWEDLAKRGKGMCGINPHILDKIKTETIGEVPKILNLNELGHAKHKYMPKEKTENDNEVRYIFQHSFSDTDFDL